MQESTSTDPSILLINCDACPFSERVRFALFCKKIPFQCKTFENEVLLSGNKPIELISRNPNGTFPVIDHDNFSVYDSTIICRYIEDAFPNFGINLWPKDLKKKFEAELILMYINNAFVPKFMSYVLNTNKSKEEELQRSFEESLMYLEYQFEKLSEGNAYFLGGELSIVDVFLAPFIERILLVTPVLKEKQEGETLAPFRKLRMWYETINENESFKKAKATPQEVIELFKRKQTKPTSE